MFLRWWSSILKVTLNVPSSFQIMNCANTTGNNIHNPVVQAYQLIMYWNWHDHEDLNYLCKNEIHCPIVQVHTLHTSPQFSYFLFSYMFSLSSDSQCHHLRIDTYFFTVKRYLLISKSTINIMSLLQRRLNTFCTFTMIGSFCNVISTFYYKYLGVDLFLCLWKILPFGHYVLVLDLTPPSSRLWTSKVIQPGIMLNPNKTFFIKANSVTPLDCWE